MGLLPRDAVLEISYTLDERNTATDALHLSSGFSRLKALRVHYPVCESCMRSSCHLESHAILNTSCNNFAKAIYTVKEQH